MARPVGAADFFCIAVARCCVWNAQQRLRQNHQRQPLARADRELLEEILDQPWRRSIAGGAAHQRFRSFAITCRSAGDTGDCPKQRSDRRRLVGELQRVERLSARGSPAMAGGFPRLMRPRKLSPLDGMPRLGQN